MYGVGGRLGRAVRPLHESCQVCVRVLGQNSECFGVEQGVRQGCVMSPWLFNLFMANMVKEAMEKFVGGAQMEATTVQLLLFADDLMLVAEKDEDVKSILRMLDEVMAKGKVQINWGKTEGLTVRRGGSTCDISVKGKKIEEVNVVKYLGELFDEDWTCEVKMENRIVATLRVIGTMRSEVSERTELSKEIKMRVFNAMVVLTLLYGCETWTVEKQHESRLQETEMRYLRRVEGVMKLDRVRNVDIRQRLKEGAVMELAGKEQRAWKVKVEEMEGERLVKRVYSEEVVGRRPREDPRKRWTDNFNY